MWAVRSILIVLAIGSAVACTSPEARRARGEPGADVGNHPQGEVRIHDGAQIYYGTRTNGDGIGRRAHIGNAAEGAGR